MAGMPNEFVNCIVTSPPYWGLRDYGVDGQLGLEDSPEKYIANLLDVFTAAWRILKKTGTMWLNLGDSYAGYWGDNYGMAQGITGDRQNIGNAPPKKKSIDFSKSKRNAPGPGNRWGGGNLPASGYLKPKDLCGIPWRVALALQASGWYLRQDIIWKKKNPMPESVKDRCSKSHEYIFLLTKSPRYYFDNAAIREPLAASTLADKRNGTGRHTQGKNYSKYYEFTNDAKPDLPSWYRSKKYVNEAAGRNRRTVWEFATRPYREAHFATFPPELPRLCIAAGCPESGLVYDPFMGAGTTALAALQLGRNYIGSELNAVYGEMAKKRLAGLQDQAVLI